MLGKGRFKKLLCFYKNKFSIKVNENLAFMLKYNVELFELFKVKSFQIVIHVTP